MAKARALPLLFTGAAMCFAANAQAAVTISTDATKNESCSAGVCTPTAKSANLNAGDLQTMLAASDVVVKTGSGATSINVLTTLTWTSTSHLSLDAIDSIHVQAPVVVAGTGALTLITNDGGTGGDYSFGPSGYVNFWDLKSSLIVNQTHFALVKSVKGLAAAVKADRTGAYALAGDYDAARDGTYSHVPVQNFLGTFEGLGHTISNLTVNAGANAGLIWAIALSGIVRDIDLANADVAATKDHVVAGLLTASNYGIIVHASVSGTLKAITAGKRGENFIGGLTGVNAGTVLDASAAAAVSVNGNASVGGLVGYSADGASISGSHASGNVSGGDKSFAGGLAGQAYAIADSYATGSVSAGIRSDAGGLAGLGDNILGSFATGSVTAGDVAFAGGLAGGGHTVADCYATGAAQTGKRGWAGGLAGLGENINRSYSTGSVSGRSKALVGGFVGYDNIAGDLSVTYWDLETSGISDPSRGAGNIANDPGITGLSDAQLKSGLPGGFNAKIWGQSPSINNGYPYLLANPPPQ